jgi:hypothetical protein
MSSRPTTVVLDHEGIIGKTAQPPRGKSEQEIRCGTALEDFKRYQAARSLHRCLRLACLVSALDRSDSAFDTTAGAAALILDHLL